MRLFVAVVVGVAIGAGIAVLVAAREQERAVADVVSGAAAASPAGETRGA